MKKLLHIALFLIFIFPCISISGENNQFINEFGFISLDGKGDIDIGKIFFGRSDYSRLPKQHLSKGETFYMSEGTHKKEIKYLGLEGDRLVFEGKNIFYFGEDKTEETKKIIIKPYKFEQYVAARNEQEIAKELLSDIEFYLQEPIYTNWLKNWLKKVGLETKDAEGNTFLLNAVDEGTIQFLLDLGADIQAVNNKGENLLMRLISRNVAHVLEPEMLKFLLTKGIDKKHRNAEGKTIQDMIQEYTERIKKDFGDSGHYQWLFEKAKINLEILMRKENCSGVYDEETQRCLDCSSPSPDVFEEPIAVDSAKKLCAMCDNRYYLNGQCHLNIKTTECHQKEGHWMSYLYTGKEDKCNPCEDEVLRNTTYEECKRCPNHIYENISAFNFNNEEDDDIHLVDCYSCFSDLSEELWMFYSKETLQKYCPNWEEILDKVNKYQRKEKMKKIFY